MGNIIDPVVEARRQADEMRRKVYPQHYQDENGDDGNTGDTQDDASSSESEGQQQQGIPDEEQGDGSLDTTQAQADTQQQTQDDPDSGTWKQRYSTLLGKYNAEVPRMQDQIGRLLERVEELQAAPQQQQTADAETNKPQDVMEALSAIREEYGDRFVDAIRSIAKAEGAELVKPMQETLQNTNQQVTKFGFYQGLDTASPGWRATNEDPKFIEWLQQAEPLSGVQYHTVLMRYFETGDVANTAKVFKMYANSAPEASNQGSTAKTNTVPEHLVAPKKTGGGTQSTVENNGGDVLSMADYEQLQRDYLNGAFKGKETEYRNKKSQFLKAATEGRLI